VRLLESFGVKVSLVTSASSDVIPLVRIFNRSAPFVKRVKAFYPLTRQFGS
jgi:hypothetical protein